MSMILHSLRRDATYIYGHGNEVHCDLHGLGSVEQCVEEMKGPFCFSKWKERTRVEKRRERDKESQK